MSSFSPQICISLSPIGYTQVSVCVQMRNTPPLFILFLTLIGANKLIGATSPRKSQNSIILYSERFYSPDLQWRFYLMNLWLPNTIITSQERNKTSPIGYISKIHLEYSLKLQYFNMKEWDGRRKILDDEMRSRN